MAFNDIFLREFFTCNRKQKSIFYNSFFILVGFLIGNLCGAIFSKTSLSPVFLIIGSVMFFEMYSYIYYKTRIFVTLNKRKINPESLKNQLLQFKRVNLIFLDYLYFVKIGLLFGLFVDAFKVGS